MLKRIDEALTARIHRHPNNRLATHEATDNGC